MRTYYSVAPRYTPGSPAAVTRAVADRVAVEELNAHARTLSGCYGAAEVARARQLGLAGIVEEQTERADAWIVRDMITGQRFVRPFPVRVVETPDQRAKRFARLSTKYARLLQEGGR